SWRRGVPPEEIHHGQDSRDVPAGRRGAGGAPGRARRRRQGRAPGRRGARRRDAVHRDRPAPAHRGLARAARPPPARRPGARAGPRAAPPAPAGPRAPGSRPRPPPPPPAGPPRRPRFAAELLAYHAPGQPASAQYAELLSAVLGAARGRAGPEGKVLLFTAV